MKIIAELHEEGITVILITHFMEEVIGADRVIIMHDGKVLLDGTPYEVFSQADVIKSANLEVPLMVELGERLRAEGIMIPEGIINEEEMLKAICQLKSQN